VDVLDIPGQKLKSRNRRIEKLPISITQVESIISWKDNHLIFRDESFEEIAKKMESWYGVEIRIEDAKLKSYRFTGKFIYNETIDQVMEVIGRTTPLRYSLNKNTLVIQSK
jgi:ferric-dicitrate binding protein FerR (iron transport regulator)